MRPWKIIETQAAKARKSAISTRKEVDDSVRKLKSERLMKEN
jgi:hypothetical protein